MSVWLIANDVRLLTDGRMGGMMPVLSALSFVSIVVDNDRDKDQDNDEEGTTTIGTKMRKDFSRVLGGSRSTATVFR